MRLGVALNVVLALWACAASAQANLRIDPAGDAVLTGAYAFGEGGAAEPRSKVLEEPARCWGAHSSMGVQQRGADVSARLDWYGPVGGALRPLRREEFERLSGTLEGRVLVLHGEHVVHFAASLRGERVAIPPDERAPVAYRLGVDERGHLVGTRTLGTGRPESFWAVRTVPSRQAPRCGAPPP